MENIMYIKWDTGHMNIVLQNFFPCSVAKFKKLLKVIALDWENCDKLTEELKVYFQNQVVECGETAKQSKAHGTIPICARKFLIWKSW